MLALVLEYVLATWLFASAFVLPHSTATAVNSMIVALLVAAVSLFAYADRKRAGIRYIISALSVWLLVAGLVMPHVALGTILHDVGVAILLGFVSLWAPARAHGGDKPSLSTT
jgi:hypothetical protein